ncbi:hypothetical protein JCM24511_01979 [Saitozyma sp. JCM 24511]|nr:hypothetical protein JCM24511_01979 [Saitozyma sp. JCM 24511]
MSPLSPGYASLLQHGEAVQCARSASVALRREVERQTIERAFGRLDIHLPGEEEEAGETGARNPANPAADFMPRRTDPAS